MSNRLRLPALVAVVSLVASVFAGTALAQVPPSVVASTEVREITVGKHQGLIFLVTNQSSAPVNYIRFGTDVDDLDPGPAEVPPFTIVNGSAFGWKFHENEGHAVFEGRALDDPTSSDDVIETGETQGFFFLADAAWTASDEVVNWQIDISTTGPEGELSAVAEAAAGALSTAIRVLKVQAVSLLGPDGVVDYTGTTGQTDIKVRSTIANYGAADLLVTPSPTLGTDDTVTTQPGPQTIPGYTKDDPSTPSVNEEKLHTANFDYTLTLGPAGTRSLIGDASTEGADALAGRSIPLEVQTAPVFNYQSAMTPTAFASGTQPKFSAAFAKIAGSDIRVEAGEMRFTNTLTPAQTFTVPMTSAPFEVRNNALPATTVSFGGATVPGDPSIRDWDGSYRTTVEWKGVDANGMRFTLTTSPFQTVTLDSLAPVVAPTLTGPGQSPNDPAVKAAKDGDTLTIGGTIKRAAGGTNDGTAVVVACDVAIHSATDGLVGEEIRRYSVPTANCRNSSTGGTAAGLITGSTTLDSGTLPGGFARLFVTARDAAGNVNDPAASPFIEIDNAAPTVAKVLTGCTFGTTGCDPKRTLRVQLSEPVRGEFHAVDFSVPDNVVVRADSACTATIFCKEVTLTTLQDFSSEGTPAVTYTHVAVPGVRSQPKDGAGFNLPAATVIAVDAIRPQLPVVDAVSQSLITDDGGQTDSFASKNGGLFYTNDLTPTVEISGLGANYTAVVLQDTNGNGRWDELDRELGTCPAEAATVRCALTEELPDGQVTVLVGSIDPAGNKSLSGAPGDNDVNAALETIVVDRDVPASSVGEMVVDPVQGKSVVVTFGEVLLAGRDVPADWRPFVLLSDGRRKMLRDASVSGTGNTRTIKFQSSETSTTVDGVMYVYDGAPSQRYRDLAGNYVGNFIVHNGS